MGCASSSTNSSKSTQNNVSSVTSSSQSQLAAASNNDTTSSNNAAVSSDPNQPKVVYMKRPARLTKEEVAQRIVSSGDVLKRQLGGIDMQIAYVSQRGYYPNALDKPNQDSYTCIPEFGTNMAFFAVYDGHGPEGHTCAWFVRDNLPGSILTHMSAFPSTTSGISKALTRAHIETNELLHSSDINDQLSGTTSISVLIIDKTIYVCNVGDSRAILMSVNSSMSPKLEVSADIIAAVGDKKRLLARPLSSDQTPYRKDERERVIRRGARVLTQDQIDGVKPMSNNFEDVALGDAIDEEGDPPRVWSTRGDYPGTAFTRSFGDYIAEQIGVFAEPEILTRELHHDDRYLILASDGVFEFLTNQMVSDMIALYSDSPLSACKIVVSAAYELWLQYETRTDDITIICIYLGDGGNIVGAALGDDNDVIGIDRRGSATNIISEAEITLSEARPVRRGLSREKKKKVIVSVSNPMLETDASDSEVFDASSVDKTKDDATVQVIASALQHNFLFQKMTPDILEAVAHCMKDVTVTAGQKVIRQGDEGDKFYVVNSGTFEVRVKPPGEIANEGDGEVVATYEAGKDLHPCFGDLALMYGQPRAATVIAITSGELWALERNVFRAALKQLTSLDPTRLLTRALRKMSLLRPLNLQQIQRMVQLLKEKVFHQGDTIIEKGQQPDRLFLVTSGTCNEVAVSNGENGVAIDEVIGHSFAEYDSFGDNGLLQESPPSPVTIRASTDVKVLYISRATFEENFGPLQEVIDIQIRRRESFSKGLVRDLPAGATADIQGISKLKSNLIKGLVGTDPLGPLMFGKFAIPGSSNETGASGNSSSSGSVNVSIRSFIISEIDRQKVVPSAKNFMLAVRTIMSCRTAAASRVPLTYSYLPKYHSLIRDSNAIHLIFKDPVVADLSDCMEKFNELRAEPTTGCSDSIAMYIVSCLIKAIDALHGMGIIFRSIQPEGVHVNLDGKIVLIDYKNCKVGGVGTKTYTICGASDYLAPEQIANSGYGAEVDLWALGVLLFELICGTNPFVAPTEVAIYRNIASFGSPKFRALRFHPDASDNAIDLINSLIVPDPSQRLGAGIAKNSLSALKRHAFFPARMNWEEGAQGSSQKFDMAVRSPLMAAASMLCAEATNEGVESELTMQFSLPYVSSGWDKGIES